MFGLSAVHNLLPYRQQYLGKRWAERPRVRKIEYRNLHAILLLLYKTSPRIIFGILV